MKLETMRTWAEISLGNLEHNYRALRACAPDSKFLGVVKANAYGHGAVPVARKLEELGADYLAVACLNEAMELRQAGIRMPILILGATPEELAGLVVDYDVTQTVFTPGLAQALSQAAGVQGRRAKIHVKVDTGMSRLGLWTTTQPPPPVRWRGCAPCPIWRRRGSSPTSPTPTGTRRTPCSSSPGFWTPWQSWRKLTAGNLKSAIAPPAGLC